MCTEPKALGGLTYKNFDASLVSMHALRYPSEDGFASAFPKGFADPAGIILVLKASRSAADVPEVSLINAAKLSRNILCETGSAQGIDSLEALEDALG